MADISLIEIFEQLRHATHTDEEAQTALAGALDALELPTKDTYTPTEVMAIGACILNAGRHVLEASREVPAPLLPYVAALAPLGELLKDDLLELQHELAATDPQT